MPSYTSRDINIPAPSLTVENMQNDFDGLNFNLKMQHLMNVIRR